MPPENQQTISGGLRKNNVLLFIGHHLIGGHGYIGIEVNLSAIFHISARITDIYRFEFIKVQHKINLFGDNGLCYIGVDQRLYLLKQRDCI